MRHFWCWAVIFNLMAAKICFAGDADVRKSRATPTTVDTWSAPYNDVLKIERRSQNRRSNLEKIVGGSLAFLLGTYGYYYDSQQKIGGKLIYSATQSGGILAISSGIIGLNAVSPLIAIDDAFQNHGELTYNQYKHIVVRSRNSETLGEIQKTAISTGLLAVLYSYNGYQERKGNTVLRNTFAFLAFNFTLFSSVSFYRWSVFDDAMVEPRSGQVSFFINSSNSLALVARF
jgi:hypothetical protein